MAATGRSYRDLRYKMVASEESGGLQNEERQREQRCVRYQFRRELCANRKGPGERSNAWSAVLLRRLHGVLRSSQRHQQFNHENE